MKPTEVVATLVINATLLIAAVSFLKRPGHERLWTADMDSTLPPFLFKFKEKSGQALCMVQQLSLLHVLPQIN